MVGHRMNFQFHNEELAQPTINILLLRKSIPGISGRLQGAVREVNFSLTRPSVEVCDKKLDVAPSNG
jgi:hypothetical protein